MTWIYMKRSALWDRGRVAIGIRASYVRGSAADEGDEPEIGCADGRHPPMRVPRERKWGRYSRLRIPRNWCRNSFNNQPDTPTTRSENS